MGGDLIANPLVLGRRIWSTAAACRRYDRAGKTDPWWCTNSAGGCPGAWDRFVVASLSLFPRSIRNLGTFTFPLVLFCGRLDDFD